MVFVLLLAATILLALTIGLAVQTQRRLAERPATVAPRRTDEQLACRILFVERRAVTDEVVLDCVVVDSPRLPPGTPFSLTVAELHTGWFAEIVDAMLMRWAEEDTVVRLDVEPVPAGSRVLARDASSRVRLDLHRRVGLG